MLNLQNLSGFGYEHDIDRKAHKPGVDPVARRDDQCRPRLECRSTQQPLLAASRVKRSQDASGESLICTLVHQVPRQIRLPNELVQEHG